MGSPTQLTTPAQLTNGWEPARSYPALTYGPDSAPAMSSVALSAEREEEWFAHQDGSNATGASAKEHVSQRSSRRRYVGTFSLLARFRPVTIVPLPACNAGRPLCRLRWLSPPACHAHHPEAEYIRCLPD